VATHSIGFEVDASKGTKGAKQFTTAINSIKAAIIDLEKTSSKSFAKLDSGFDGSFFRTLKSAVREFNSIKISAASIGSIRELAETSKQFKAPTKAQSRNLSTFATALRKIQAPKGTEGVRRFTRALAEFKPPTLRQTTNLKNFVNVLGNLRVPKNARAIANALDMITGSATRASASLRGLRGTVSSLGLRRLSMESRKASKSVTTFGNSLNLAHQGGSLLRNTLGALTLGAFTSNIFAASNAVQTFNVTMETVSGSAASARTDLAFVRKMATDLAIDLRTAQTQFASFAAASKVAGLEAATARDIFKSVSIAMTVLNRTTQDQELSFLALQQMISKGTVSSEELRRQLGERLPGALEIMARSLGVTGKELNKMLKAGTILSKDALPKFAKELELIFGAGVPAALKRTSSQLKLLRNDFESVLLDLGEAGFMDALTEGVKEFRTAIATEDFRQFTINLGEGLGQVVTATAKGLSLLADNTTLLRLAMQSIPILLAIKLFGTLRIALTATGGRTAALGLAFGITSKSLVRLGGSAQVATTLTKRLGFSLRALKIALGPIGLAFIAIEVVMQAYTAATEKGTKASESYTNVLNTLGESAESAKVALEDLTTGEISLLKFDLSKSTTELENDISKAITDLNKVIEEESGSIRFIGRETFEDTRRQFSKLTGATQEFVLDVVSAFNKGSGSATELQDSLNGLAESSPRAKELVEAWTPLVRTLITAEKNLKNVKDQQRAVKEAQDQLNPSLEEGTSKVEASGEAFIGTAGKVKSFLSTLKRGGEETKSFAVNVASLRKATQLFNEEVAKKPSLEAQKSLEGLNVILLASTKGLIAVTANHSTELGINAALTDKLTQVGAKHAASSREVLVAQNELEDSNRRLVELSAKREKLTESINKTQHQLTETTNESTVSTETYNARLAELTRDTSALDRTTRALASKALSKIAPTLASAIVETDRMSDAMDLLNQLQKDGFISVKQSTEAYEEFGKKLGTVATAGARAADIVKDLQGKITAAETKKTLGGEALARFTAVDKFRSASEKLQKELKKASDAGSVEQVNSVQEAINQFDDQMRSIGDKAVKAFRDKARTRDEAKFDKEISGLERLIGRNDALAKSRSQLRDLEDLGNISIEKREALMKKMGVTQLQFNAILQQAIKIKEEETRPGETLLAQMEDEIALLGMSTSARRIASAMRSIEIDLLRKGKDLTLEENKLLRENILLTLKRKDALENPVGIQATIAAIGTLEESLQDVNRMLSEDLIDSMATFLATGEFNFKKFADSIIADMARIAAQQVFKSLFSKVLNIALIAATGSNSSLGIEGGGTGLFKEGGLSTQPIATTRVPISSFSSAPHFADGTANTSGGIPAILHDNEAVIPLSRNRTIPVELSGVRGGNTTIVHNTFNIDVEDNSTNVEDRIKGAVVEVVPAIIQASRAAAMEDTVELLSRSRI